jgi:hypothetical protein
MKQKQRKKHRKAVKQVMAQRRPCVLIEDELLRRDAITHRATILTKDIRLSFCAANKHNKEMTRAKHLTITTRNDRIFY